MKKIGLIGVGGYASVYYNALKDLAVAGEIELAGVVIRHPEKEPEKHAALSALGTRIYSSGAAMYDGEKNGLDLVCIPTGIQYHEAMTEEALQRGVNVLVEKPVAGSIDAVRRMIAAEARSKNWVAVGFQHIYEQSIHDVKKMIMAGEIGTVKNISVMGLWPRDDHYYNRNNWAGKLKSNDEWVLDSPINNAFAHYLNIALFWCGREFMAMAKIDVVDAELFRARPIETFDTCSICLKTENDVRILCHFTHASGLNINPRIRVDGMNGTIEWGPDLAYEIRKKSGDSKRMTFAAPHPQMFDKVMAKLSDSKVFVCTLRMGGNHTYCIDLIQQQAKVKDIPAEYFTINPDNGTYQIKDIDCYFFRAYTDNCLLSELGEIPWAKK